MFVFLLAYIFWRSGSDMLSQNFQVSSDYACDMVIFVCFPNFFIFIQMNNKLSVELKSLRKSKDFKDSGFFCFW